MVGEHPQKDLAPRDIVARAIDSQLKSTGAACVFLDLTHRSRKEIEERFPNIVSTCMERGLDPSAEPLPVVPAAHYMCGGIPTGLDGQTSIPGLFAIGEVACTGVHGANRLASNSLLEGLVFAETAANRLKELLSGPSIEVPEAPIWDVAGTRVPRERILISHDRKEIRNLMWDYVGLVRSRNRLDRAERRLALITREIELYYRWTKVTAELLELRNIAQVGLLIVRSALSRQESRGLHYVTDYPERSPDLDGVDTMVPFDWGTVSQ
jgi:L-aspartate oxidase